MRRYWKHLLILALVLIAVWWWRRDSSAQPDEKLAARFDDLCEIAGDNIKTPKAGVVKWFGYLGLHAPDMLEQFGAMLVAIETIPDEDKHDERARVAARRLHVVFQRCEKPLNEFFDAVQRDPKAAEMYAYQVERLGRTLAILAGADSTGLFGERLMLEPAR